MTQPDLTGLASHLTRPSINIFGVINIENVDVGYMGEGVK
ncbi:hypothetical protein PIIN_09794 [Serendipita indica DSM 11827]|uniref:Uncharacterized protein n=1 Tax=Serendipita indica (strain DSM 11827) TaxID=1109443 RepID=G4TWW3_SERID|nr:hypothetical protein PIIN_09794 [Serendipita indica DSM 11827]